jgi:hypothetical protein
MENNLSFVFLLNFHSNQAMNKHGYFTAFREEGSFEHYKYQE